MELKSVFDELEKIVDENLTEENFNSSKNTILKTLNNVLKETRKKIKELKNLSFEDCKKLDMPQKIVFALDSTNSWFSSMAILSGAFSKYDYEKGEMKNE